MKKYVAKFFNGDCRKTQKLGVYNNKKDAIDCCIENVGDYCLDSEETRRKALETLGFCVLGCGPSRVMIEEISE